MPWFKDKCVLCLMSDMSVKSVCETVRKHTELLAGGMCVIWQSCVVVQLAVIASLKIKWAKCHSCACDCGFCLYICQELFITSSKADVMRSSCWFVCLSLLFRLCAAASREKLCMDLHFTIGRSWLSLKLISLPCDAMQVRPMSSCGVCPYICVSVTFVYSVKTNKHIIKNFSLSGSHTILHCVPKKTWPHCWW